MTALGQPRALAFYDSGMKTQLWCGVGRCLEGLKTLHPWGQVSRDDSRFQDDRSLYLPDRTNLFLPLFLSTPPHTLTAEVTHLGRRAFSGKTKERTRQEASQRL